MKSFILLSIFVLFLVYKSLAGNCGDFDERCCVYQPVKGGSQMEQVHLSYDPDYVCPNNYVDQFGDNYVLCVSSCVFSDADCQFTYCPQ
ncbi:hypothetical protein M0811_08189 [Anaeramoeba ignava]|uniref:Uncharacterized protein n=1 Tax=Anaeramoeba ignava TaxID=1746090 RepID=A0A9Q0RB92_ANAIG|nr:hypothetical protein M0811_08189 [Anaeramoeba ignava]